MDLRTFVIDMYTCPLCGETANRRGETFDSVEQVVSHVEGSHDDIHSGVRGVDIRAEIDSVEHHTENSGVTDATEMSSTNDSDSESPADVRNDTTDLGNDYTPDENRIARENSPATPIDNSSLIASSGQWTTNRYLQGAVLAVCFIVGALIASRLVSRR